ncbi:MAG: GNAT family N-acetyltransferase [Myxococcota bacterium]
MTTLPEHVLRFWRALDEQFGSVEPAWWGAVVTDARFPMIWDANYARVDVAAPDLRLADIEGNLLPALRDAGAPVMHVVMFHPEEATSLLSELSSRGDRLGWDLVMDLDGEPPPPTDVEVEPLEGRDDLWDTVADSLVLFGAEPGHALDQFRTLERDVLAPAGKRWFGVVDRDGRVQSLGALVVLGDVGYVDNIATFPPFRGRGLASAVTATITQAARRAGANHVFLLADPEASAIVSMYERLGFGSAGTLASARGPIPGTRSDSGG